MKHKISFDYNEAQGLTIATLKTSRGTFYGTSYKHPDDKYSSSYIIGTNIAEARAWINFYNKEITNKKLELKGLKRLLAAMPDDKPGKEYVWRLHNAIETEIEDLKIEKALYKGEVSANIEARNIYLRSRNLSKEDRKRIQEVIRQGFEQISNQDKIDKEDE